MSLRDVAKFAIAAALAAGVLGAAAADAGAPMCSTLPQPFPCAAGTHPVCTAMTKCYGGKPGIVPILTSICTQAKCVKTPPRAVTGNESRRPILLNPQPEPPGAKQ